MSFTKRDYEAIARIISQTQRHVCSDPDTRMGWHAGVSAVRVRLQEHFAADNPRFDAERFAKACEPGGGK